MGRRSLALRRRGDADPAGSDGAGDDRRHAPGDDRPRFAGRDVVVPLRQRVHVHAPAAADQRGQAGEEVATEHRPQGGDAVAPGDAPAGANRCCRDRRAPVAEGHARLGARRSVRDRAAEPRVPGRRSLVPRRCRVARSCRRGADALPSDARAPLLAARLRPRTDRHVPVRLPRLGHCAAARAVVARRRVAVDERTGAVARCDPCRAGQCRQFGNHAGADARDVAGHRRADRWVHATADGVALLALRPRWRDARRGARRRRPVGAVRRGEGTGRPHRQDRCLARHGPRG